MLALAIGGAETANHGNVDRTYRASLAVRGTDVGRFNRIYVTAGGEFAS
jgi:hypothetical protein